MVIILALSEDDGSWHLTVIKMPSLRLCDAMFRLAAYDSDISNQCSCGWLLMGSSFHGFSNGAKKETTKRESSCPTHLTLRIEKLDAGLRSLDHCELSCPLNDMTLTCERQDQAAKMEIRPSTETHSPGSLGDAVSGCDAKAHALAGSRFLLLDYS